MKRRPARPLQLANATGNGVKEKPCEQRTERHFGPTLSHVKKRKLTLCGLSAAEDVHDCGHHLLPFLKSCFAAKIISRDTDTCVNFQALFLASGA